MDEEQLINEFWWWRDRPARPPTLELIASKKWRECVQRDSWRQIALAVHGMVSDVVVEGTKSEYERAAFIYEIKARRVTQPSRFPPRWEFKKPFIDLARHEMILLGKQFRNNRFALDRRFSIPDQQPDPAAIITFDSAEEVADILKDIAFDPSKSSRNEVIRSIARYIDEQMRRRKLAWGKHSKNAKVGKSSKRLPWDVIEDADRMVNNISLGENEENKKQNVRRRISHYRKIRK